MPRQIPQLRKTIVRARKELESARELHERREKGIDDLINRIVTVKKSIELFRAKQNIYKTLAKEAQKQKKFDKWRKFKNESTEFKNHADAMQKRETGLLGEIDALTGRKKAQIERKKTLQELKVEAASAEVNEAREDLEKMIRIVGQNHPAVIESRRRLLKAKSNFQEELWKINQQDIAAEKNPSTRRELEKYQKITEKKFFKYSRKSERI
ncbi:MAG: hypothetical protein AABW59_05685 [archaeon]